MSVREIMTAQDSALLAFERPKQRLVIGCVLDIEGEVPFDELVEVIVRRSAELPRYRQRPVRSAFDVASPVWEDDPDFNAARHVRRVGVPQPAGREEVSELLETLFIAPFDPEHPLWDVTLLERPGRARCLVLARVHHCMSDGMRGLEVLDFLTDEHPPGGSPQVVALDAVAREASAVDEVTERKRPASVTELRLAARLAAAWQRACDVGDVAALTASLLSDPAPALPFNGHLSGRRRFVWRSFPLDDLLLLRAEGRCTVNDVVLAIIAGALRNYLTPFLPQRELADLRLVVPVSVRRDADRSSGNCVSAMFPRLPIRVDDPLSRLRAVARETRELKANGQARSTALLLAAGGRLPPLVQSLLGRLKPDTPLFHSICTHVRGPEQKRWLAGRRIEGIHAIVPLFQGIGLGFAVLRYADRVSLCAALDPALVPDGERIGSALEASFQELRDARASANSRPRNGWIPPQAASRGSGLTQRAATIDRDGRSSCAANLRLRRPPLAS